MTPKDIRTRIENRFKYDLSTKRGKHIISKLNFCYIVVCLKFCKFTTYEQITEEIGKKHCSVNHAIKRHDELLKYDKEYIKIWEEMQYLFNLVERPKTIKKLKKNINNKAILSVFNELSKFSDTQLLEFKETRLKPFMMVNSIN